MRPLTARGVKNLLGRAKVDYSALTITDDPAVWTDLETGFASTSVIIEGPRLTRERAAYVLFEHGLGNAPYPEKDCWSRRPLSTRRRAS
jgi:hypothetical protein